MLGYARKSEDFANRIQKKFELRLKDLPKESQDQIREVKQIEDERQAMQFEFEKEINKLKAQYELKLNEILSNRAKVITNKEVFKYFWMKTLVNAKALYNLITDDDKRVLKALTNISYVITEDQKNIKLIFDFIENEYFNDTSIVKEYQLGDDSLIQSIKSTSIDWKKDKKYFSHKSTKKMKNKSMFIYNYQ